MHQSAYVALTVVLITALLHGTCLLQDWARPGDIDNLNLQWHIPSSAELDLVDKALNNFLGAELDALDKFMNGEEMERCTCSQHPPAEMNLIRICAFRNTYVWSSRIVYAHVHYVCGTTHVCVCVCVCVCLCACISVCASKLSM